MIKLWDMDYVGHYLHEPLSVPLGRYEDSDLLISVSDTYRIKNYSDEHNVILVEGFVREELVFTMFDFGGGMNRDAGIDSKWIHIEQIDSKWEMALASYVINWARDNDVPCYLRDNKEDQ